MTFNIPKTDKGLAPPLNPPAPAVRGGYAQPEVLQETVREEAPFLPPAASGAPDTFLAAAADYLRGRIKLAEEAGQNLTGVVTLIKVEYPRVEGESRGMERVRAFKFSETVELSGRVFIVSGSLSDAYTSDHNCSDISEAFGVAEQVQLAICPTVMVNFATRELLWLPQGTENEESSMQISMRGDPLPLVETMETAIVDAIQRFHDGWTRAPEALPGIWADEPGFIPTPDVETRIQNFLFPALWSRFRDTHIVRREDSVIRGRTDLSITPRRDRGGNGMSLVGVTVLRSMQPPVGNGEEATPVDSRDNDRAIEAGLNSADLYRNVLGCADIIWCLFDMQRIDDEGALAAMHRGAAEARHIALQRYVVPNRARFTPTGASVGLQN